MPSLPVVRFTPSPLPGHALVQSKSTVSPSDWHRPSREADAAISGPDIRPYPLWFRALCVGLLLAGAVWACSCLGPNDMRACAEACKGRMHHISVASCECLPDSQLKPQAEEQR